MNEHESLSKEDRISQLPDGILCHILSFLPIKCALATCILFSRWKFVWTLLPNLCFDERLHMRPVYGQHMGYIFRKDGFCFSEDPNPVFENFVTRVLHLTNPTAIGKFSLDRWALSDLTRFRSWVDSIIMRNVCEIELFLGSHKLVRLPESICTLKTLEVLKLYSDFVIKIPPSGLCFRSLKVLTVVLEYPDNNLTERLFSICPALEDLSIGHLDDKSLINFNISSTTLKRLCLSFTNGVAYSNNWHKVMIATPNLELLNIHDFCMVSYMFHELPPFTKVFIDIFYDDGWSWVQSGRAQRLLNSLTKAKFLALSADTVYALDKIYKDVFPKFPNVTCLAVKVELFGWRLLPIILSSLPNLEEFVFEKKLSCHFEEFGWIEQPNIPLCLLLHVKKIEIKKFEGQKDELGLVKYLLKNCKVLNKVIIRCKETASKENLCQKLDKLQRGSMTCEVEIF
ncbi:hypothetical protein CICLE_v10015203mg [Citrus x clementina]|uniref:FBD domain-containing protein n=1 Tax=Citrus clementina TaxID=85681 RepID=V4U5F5_CITCL|nr:F-box/FBD/LRR-repeat protein At5g56420 [Citrus x clementina]XP_024046778.1 F-box/FBD/LRR-repeat protein At5g56420 [Citrus x clementina]ESR59320.1 hypothetical protein CICLE_v10015203mg [Citrus x clementina]